MPRQNFISKDFFTFSTEEDTKRALLSLPQFVNMISFVGENKLLQSWRFTYEHPKSTRQYIDVALIPLNDGHVRITLHGTYANGHSFYKDGFLTNALLNFERALQAAIAGTSGSFVAIEPRVGSSEKAVHLVLNILAFLGGSILSKKLSGGAPF
jgi:hypothetical protein